MRLGTISESVWLSNSNVRSTQDRWLCAGSLVQQLGLYSSHSEKGAAKALAHREAQQHVTPVISGSQSTRVRETCPTYSLKLHVLLASNHSLLKAAFFLTV